MWQIPCLPVYALDVLTIPSVLLDNASTSQAEVNEQEDGNLTGLTVQIGTNWTDLSHADHTD